MALGLGLDSAFFPGLGLGLDSASDQADLVRVRGKGQGEDRVGLG